MPTSNFFDLSSPDIFFQVLKKAASELKESQFKSTSKLMFVVMGLNHLREWIAPDYDCKKEAKNPAEKFFCKIFSLEEFKTVRALCNRSKHMKVSKTPLFHTQCNSIDHWPEIDSVENIDLGPPTDYFVGDRDVQDIIACVIEYYETHWFRKRVLAV